jgi:hypothetical protein
MVFWFGTCLVRNSVGTPFIPRFSRSFHRPCKQILWQCIKIIKDTWQSLFIGSYSEGCGLHSHPETVHPYWGLPQSLQLNPVTANQQISPQPFPPAFFPTRYLHIVLPRQGMSELLETSFGRHKMYSDDKSYIMANTNLLHSILFCSHCSYKFRSQFLAYSGSSRFFFFRYVRLMCQLIWKQLTYTINIMIHSFI